MGGVTNKYSKAYERDSDIEMAVFWAQVLRLSPERVKHLFKCLSQVVIRPYKIVDFISCLDSSAALYSVSPH